jgi:hypothetical protein
MKWYNFEENYSASQVTWKATKTDETCLMYMGWSRGLAKAKTGPDHYISWQSYNLSTGSISKDERNLI